MIDVIFKGILSVVYVDDVVDDNSDVFQIYSAAISILAVGRFSKTLVKTKTADFRNIVPFGPKHGIYEILGILNRTDFPISKSLMNFQKSLVNIFSMVLCESGIEVSFGMWIRSKQSANIVVSFRSQNSEK